MEISVLHEQLNRVDTENNYLRTGLDQMRVRLQHREKIRNTNCSLQTSINFQRSEVQADACCQTNDDQEQQCLDQINQILALTERVNEKDDIIAKYHKECEEMFEAIQKLETSNKEFLERHAADKDLLNKLDEKLRREEQMRIAA